MRASPRLILILSAIAAVEAARGSRYRHARPKNADFAPVISAVPNLATSKTASEIVYSVATPSVESVEIIQTQDVISTIPTVPTEAVQVPKPANNDEGVKFQEPVISNQKAVSSSTRQPKDGPVVAFKEPTKRFCGKPNESEVLFGTPWIVFSMNYNHQYIKGSSCVGYYDHTGSGNDQTIHWSVIWDIDPDVGTNLVKGYNFIGLTQGLETRLSDIKSIPSKYEWTTSKSTEYKGNVVYDFMTCDTKGDSTSNRAQELMLWLNWHGGQVPIGWGEGPVATIDGLFGKDGWKLYQGVNADTGITVTSLLCPEDDQFGNDEGGSFEGDIKDWLVALSKNGVFKSDTYVNVGNAGMEPYYGTVDFDNYLSLRINV
ncbi:hypothetical protein NW768_002688 [Fusarium equiseti]|uniref:Uncharacterized protein n=1 Tax=Fusarium equiseti TaxID=61235 RepID=A0ABQ8RP98_FUSEQ|nr:hypothetical protein NW768_002688 [Fusarium equiseti]